MPHFQKRGNRIRASDKSPVFRFSAGSLLLLFLTVVLLLNLKTIAATDWKLVHFLQDGGVHLTVNGYNVQDDDQLATMVANKINDMMEEDNSVFK